jgi:hypothetical protein
MKMLDLVLEYMGTWIWLLMIGLIASLMVVLAIGTYRKKATGILDVGKQLYLALWNPIIDYSFKVFVGIKNLYYFPIGVDHRIFRSTYSRISNDSGRATLKSEKNLYPVTPKANYHLLCLTVWAVAFYIYWAVKSIILTLYKNTPEDAFTHSLPLIIAIATFLLDVWIVRSYEFIPSAGKKSSKIAVTVLRFFVSICTASLAAFHILSISFANEITEVSRNLQLINITKTADYQQLTHYRDNLAIADFNSQGLRHCLNVLTTGRSKGQGKIVFPSTEFDRIYQIYLLPPEQTSSIKNINQLKVMQYDCSLIAREDEPVCQVAWADSKSCPRFASNAKKGFIEDVGHFGLSETLKRGWFDVTKSYPELLKLEEKDTDKDKKTPLKATYEALYKKIFVDKFESNAKNDISIALGAIEKKAPSYGFFGIFLLLAPVLIVALFEFSVLIVKTIWGRSQIDAYLHQIDNDSGKTIISGTVTPLQNSYLDFSSDFYLQDHISNVLGVFSKVIQPLMESKIFSLIVFFALFVGVFKLIEMEFFSYLSGILKIIAKIINNFLGFVAHEVPNLPNSL